MGNKDNKRYRFRARRFDDFGTSHVPVIVMYTDQFDDGNVVTVQWGCSEYWTFSEEQRLELIKYISENTMDENTRFIFEQPWEGYTRGPLIELHKLIKEISLKPKNCFFVTCGLEVRRFYNDLCIEHGITEAERVNVIALNQWENATWNRALPEPVFTVGLKKKKFLCFNRRNRIHRTALVGLLWEKDLIRDSYCSFYGGAYGCDLDGMLKIYLRWGVSTETCERIWNQFSIHDKEIPLVLNLSSVEDNINWVRPEDCELFETSYFSVVTETFFFDSTIDESSVFFSEKIFKPIAQKHPFIMLNRPGALSFLRKMGYKTFHPFINEDFDEVVDCEQRLLMIVSEIERLCNQTDEMWIEWQKNIQEVVEHNYKVFISKIDSDYIFDTL